MRTLLVNFKNYQEILGYRSVKLAQAVKKAGEAPGVEAIVAPPIPELARVASEVEVRVFSQTVGREVGDKTTGSIIPEAVKASGGSGTILNHSEARKSHSELLKLVPRLKEIGLDVCLCTQTAVEASELSVLGPKYLAVEPPELIGTGISVSRAKPQLIRATITAARRAGFEGSILCGAGILSGEDVERAVELGVDGILVASSVVKARDWEAKVRELANPLR